MFSEDNFYPPRKEIGSGPVGGLIDNVKGRLPAVSIGLPVFNGEDYLQQAIESLLNQTFRDFEIIISDNASTDSTRKIALEYQRLDFRIRYIRQEVNIGAGKNFLFVLAEARANLFMWASHDDIWAENWLEVLVRNLTPEDMGIRGNLFLLRGQSVVARKALPSFRKGDFVRCFFGNENNYRSHYTYSLFHKLKLLSVDPRIFDMDYYADAVLIYAMLHEGTLRTIPDTHLWYRLHDQNFGIGYSRRWKGWHKFLYRIHPLRYYLYCLRVTRDPATRLIIAALIPFKHIYAQTSFWLRGARELLTGKQIL